MSQFYAHSLGATPEDQWQPLSRHLKSVEELAAARGAKFEVGNAAGQAGLFHDLGKYSAEFQARIRDEAERVDHSTAGAREVLSLDLPTNDKLMAQLIAHAIAGHHAGLPNTFETDASLDKRLKRQIPDIDDIWRNEIRVEKQSLLPSFDWGKSRDRAARNMAFLGRMIFSCLVDADFRDTEAFYAAAENKIPPRDWDTLPAIIDRLISRVDSHSDKIKSSAEKTPVNELRADILAHVRNKADMPQGLFTLTVPTGGGKTLSSLAFALDHAKKHKLDRIIYTIPFTSIIDQTASIFRRILETPGDEFILEHHSSIDEPKVGDRVGVNKLRLAMEDWAAPIVVTTNVQLFESLYSARPSRCRKLHNIANSVIVLDEAQTIPLKVLTPCLEALDELVRNYGVSVVFCTATQPAVAKPKFKRGLDLVPERELAPPGLFSAPALKRVTIAQVGEMNDDALVAALAQNERSLVIVNSRKHALDLYQKVKDAGLPGAIHLTTRQYANHRREVLDSVRTALADKNHPPCRLIATSLVEAGVDLDFPRVWRAEAGLEQIAQAAGRCNREGRGNAGDSVVTVFKPSEHKPPSELALFAEAMARMRNNHADLLSREAIEEYFREVYFAKGEKELDIHEVLSTDNWSESNGELRLNYRKIGDAFRLIDNAMLPVVIARAGVAREAKACKAIEDFKNGWITARAAARILQPFIVQTPPKDRMRLIDAGLASAIDPEGQFVRLNEDDRYSEDIGLTWENANLPVL